MRVLFHPDEYDPPARPRPWDAVYSQRTEYDLKRVQVPPVPEREIEEFLRFRMRTFYPGDPARAELSFRLAGLREERVATVVVADRVTIADVRAFARGAKVFGAASAFRLAPEGGKVLFLGRGWAEEAVVDGGIVVEVAHATRTDDGDPGFPVDGVVAVVGGGSEAAPFLSAGARAWSWEEVARLAGRNDLFGDGRVERGGKGAFKTLVLACCALVACVCVARLAKAAAYDLLASIAERALATDSAFVRALADSSELSLPAARSRGALGFLYSVKSLSIKELKIISLDLRGTAFSMELLAANALEAVEKLRSAPGFSDISVRKITPVGGGESFVVTGKVVHDSQ